MQIAPRFLRSEVALPAAGPREPGSPDLTVHGNTLHRYRKERSYAADSAVGIKTMRKTIERASWKPQLHTSDYLKMIGVPEMPPATSPFDPGYDPATLQSHLDQSAHLMSILKISMACWMIASEAATRWKLAVAKKHHVPTVTGGGPFEIAVAQGQLTAYLDLCADLGVTRIECGEGFTEMTLRPGDVVKMANERDLDVQFELGKKHTG